MDNINNIIYLLGFTSIIVTLYANLYINIVYNKYKNVTCKKRVTGKETARTILDSNNLKKVEINKVRGNLSDHYNPSTKEVNLSSDVYSLTSISSIAVASHECGHALQDKDNYTFMIIRSKLVPFVNFSSKIGYIAILIGIIFSLIDLIYIGIVLEIVILIFQLVTLPVEINASKRALIELKKLNLVTEDEADSAKKVLKAAAFTYVASVLTTIIEILRLLLIFSRKDD